jgi:sarcosine oxidase
MYDLIVVGLGVYGASVVRAAATAGLKVLGVDQSEVPNLAGSSHGRSRIFRRTTLESRRYARLADRAADIWAEIDAQAEDELIVPSGFALVSPLGTHDQTHHGVSGVIEAAVHAASKHGVEYRRMTGADLMSEYAGLRVSPDDAVFFEPGAFLIRPEAAVSTLLDLARVAGAELLTSTKVGETRSMISSAYVTIEGTRVSAKNVVLCTGPWRQRELLGLSTLDVSVFPQVSLLVEKKSGALDGSYPAFVHLGSDGFLSYGIPAVGAIAEAKISIEQSKVSIESPMREHLPVGFQEEQARRARHAASVLTPTVDFENATRDLCFYTTTWNSQLVVERKSDLPRITVVSACSGHGFKYAPAIAERIVSALNDPTFSLES